MIKTDDITEKECAECLLMVPIDQFGFYTKKTPYREKEVWRSKCDPCLAKKQREKYWSDPDKHRGAVYRSRKKNVDKYRLLHRQGNLRRKYGLNPEDYESLLNSQNRVCAICLGPPIGRGMCLHVDHDHTTGVIRGLLCTRCNTAIGMFRDSPELLEAAKQYLDIILTADVRKKQK